MRVVVQKYGGSSVSDVDKIRQVAERVAATRAEGYAVVVVVSAMGNTTNELIALAREVTANPDRRELDMLLSSGERMSMALLTFALHDLGVPARSLTGSQSGIVTDENHADARVVEVRPDRVRQRLEAGEVVVVAGFQGVSRDREVTTLGRGGSDTTAVVLAAALGADWCEICSDVDGVWSADPRQVPGARRVDEMSLDSALSLARGGAKVLFEDSVRYARDHGVVVRASLTSGPGAGTRLVTATTGAGVVAVTGDDRLIRVRFDGQVGAAVRALEVQGARLRRWSGRVAHFDVRNVHGAITAPAGAVVDGDVAVVLAAGSGVGESGSVIEAGERSLITAGIPSSDAGSSGDGAWWEVARDRLAEAVGVVHQALIG
jgi:aspartate kinase